MYLYSNLDINTLPFARLSAEAAVYGGNLFDTACHRLASMTVSLENFAYTPLNSTSISELRSYMRCILSECFIVLILMEVPGLHVLELLRNHGLTTDQCTEAEQVIKTFWSVVTSVDTTLVHEIPKIIEQGIARELIAGLHIINECRAYGEDDSKERQEDSHP